MKKSQKSKRKPSKRSKKVEVKPFVRQQLTVEQMEAKDKYLESIYKTRPPVIIQGGSD